MPYRYRCPRCRTTSRPYLTRSQARDHGQHHRDTRHGGDHPDGERIVHAPWPRPRKSELLALIVVAGLVLAALVDKYR